MTRPLNRIKNAITYRGKRAILFCKALFYWIALFFSKPDLVVKYFPSWLKSVRTHRMLEYPWFNFEAIYWLDRHLAADMTVFEYGSGSSTFYFARKVKNVYSVEHDKSWYEKVKSDSHYPNITLYLISPTDETETDVLYRSTDPQYQGKSFERYADKIAEFPDNFFDVICVDGRARNACLRAAKNKVKPNGIVILDNSEREEYAWGKDQYAGWKCLNFVGVMNGMLTKSQTTVWVRQ